MNILLTGANGFIGHHIATRLTAAGHHIQSASRSTGCDFKRMTTPESWLAYLQNKDVVINCVGIIAETSGRTFDVMHHLAPAALFHACAAANIKRVIQISALGADEQAFTPYQRSKKAADDVLRSLPLDWFVLRPSLVYGAGGKSMQMFQQLSRMPVLALMDGGKQIIQPVQVQDLVDTVLTCLQTASTRQTLDVVGAQAITFGEWLQCMRKKRNQKSAYVLPIPYAMVLTFTQIAKYLLPILHPDNIRMLQHGSFSDVTPLAKFIGHMPMDVETGLKKI